MAVHLNKGFQEAETGIIELEDDDQNTVERLLTYLYSGDYSVSSKVTITSPADTSASTTAHSQEILAHISVYIIAEKFDLPCLKKLSGKTRSHRVNL